MIDRHIHTEVFSALVRYGPMWAHLSVYVFTCLIAAVLFYFDYRPVLVFVEYFSGVTPPKAYTFQQTVVLWALLLGGPILFALGYCAAIRIHLDGALPLLRRFAGPSDQDVSVWIPRLLFVTVAIISTYDLARAGAFAKLGLWSDYGAWVEGRWALFSTLGYFNFVNVYLFMPVSAAWLILSIKGEGWKAFVTRLIPLVVVVALTLLLFQKKALIVSLIIIFGAVLLHKVLLGAWTRRLTWLFAVTTGFLVTVYFVLVVLPIYSETSRTAGDVLIQQGEKSSDNHKPCEKPGTSDEIKRVCRGVVSYIGADRNSHVITYALLAPMTRTSLPAMYYPMVFPEQHEYYGLDFGQDILGFGGMPDDNLVIWKYMYPNLPGGSAGAPYQFALYSQVGVVWTLLLCAMVGVALGVMWQLIFAGDISRIWRSLMGAVLMLFSIYLAIDSIRGSLLASYGLLWAWLFISLSFFIGRLLNRRQEFGLA